MRERKNKTGEGSEEEVLRVKSEERKKMKNGRGTMLKKGMLRLMVNEE